MRYVRLAPLLFLAMAGFSPAWSCGAPDTATLQNQSLQDLSWVRASATLFISNPTGGIRRLQLGEHALVPLEEHPSETTAPMSLSDDKRWFLYQARGGLRNEYRLYDLKQRQTHKLDLPHSSLNGFAFSPDSRRLAFLAASGREVAIVSLETQSTAHYRPTDEMLSQGRSIGPFWSDNANDLLISYAPHGGSQLGAWALSAHSGQFRPISATFETKKEWRFFEDGKQIGSKCLLCFGEATKQLELNDKAKVSLTDHQIILTIPGQPARVVAEVPKPVPRDPNGPALACSSGGIQLLGAIDGQYILYRTDGLHWIYGLAENRKALLSNQSYTQLTW